MTSQSGLHRSDAAVAGGSGEGVWESGSEAGVLVGGGWRGGVPANKNEEVVNTCTCTWSELEEARARDGLHIVLALQLLI